MSWRVLEGPLRLECLFFTFLGRFLIERYLKDNLREEEEEWVDGSGKLKNGGWGACRVEDQPAIFQFRWKPWQKIKKSNLTMEVSWWNPDIQVNEGNPRILKIWILIAFARNTHQIYWPAIRHSNCILYSHQLSHEVFWRENPPWEISPKTGVISDNRNSASLLPTVSNIITQGWSTSCYKKQIYLREGEGRKGILFGIFLRSYVKTSSQAWKLNLFPFLFWLYFWIFLPRSWEM